MDHTRRIHVHLKVYTNTDNLLKNLKMQALSQQNKNYVHIYLNAQKML